MSEQSVDLEIADGVVRGTLAGPAYGQGPVVLIIAGSGPTDRDGNNPLAVVRRDSYRLLAHALARQGIFSLRYDKRGVAGSASVHLREADLRFEDYVADAVAWVNWLYAQGRFAEIVVLGHSEGALIGTLVAQRVAVRACVSVAGAGVPAATVLRRQLKPRVQPVLFALCDSMLVALERKQHAPDVPEGLWPLFRPSVQPYLMSWFRYDPVQEMARLRIPCLVVQGDADAQIGLEDARALHAACHGSTLLVIPGMDHALMQCANPSNGTEPLGEPSLAGVLPRAIADFIAASA